MVEMMMVYEYNKRHSEDKFLKPIVSTQFVLVLDTSLGPQIPHIFLRFFLYK